MQADGPGSGWPGLDDDWLADDNTRWLDGGLSTPTDEERAVLALDRRALVLRGRWLQLRDRRPQGLISRCLPTPGGAALLDRAAAAQALSRAGADAARSRQRAAAATADAAQAALLELARGAPLLVLQQVRHAGCGRPIEARTAVWRADSANVLMELRR
jgi:GntR family transcriptional regulator